ncbi:hypothetical protein HRI_001343900 [Hibiscus trionum]|uniref:CCHC-type domain-containing protein n=1 Tax=Hibiscus trionum TaxID=183268 RepID=A0A9W7LUX3_HIBTR|nr:hypothetical protein HRI_001343900 [Hibiscus trionum]
MASTSSYESQSTTKPPFFNGDNYLYWKNRMRLFIKSTDFMVWDVVEEGPYIPMRRDGERLVPKIKAEMTDDERRRMQVNDKALHVIFCALGPDIYSKVSSIENAKEVWDTLETTYEGTSDVKETKIGLLNLNYENFKMDPDESVSQMFDRFSVIVNGLKGFREIIPEDKLVRKLLYSLPESWDSKRTAIIEAKDLKTLKLDALVGSLLTHEIMRKGREQEKKMVEKKEVEKKKVGIALKASQLENDSSEDEEEEMAMLAKRFTQFMKSNRGRKFMRRRDFKSKNKEEEIDQITCYECNKPGHIRSECPQLKKKSFGRKNKLKAQIATWSDDESSVEEEEVANLCLMAIDDESKGEHCFKAKASSKNSWYLDSGCSRHMTGDKSRFVEIKPKSGGVVTFGDNSKGLIEGISSIGNHSSIYIKDVLYVNGLKHNLLSISQLCDKDDIHSSHACLVAHDEHDSWLWHRKLGHASMSVLEKLNSLNLVRENLGKFDAKSDEAIFLGYSSNSKAYRVFNKRTLVVEESIHVVFDDNLLSRKESCDDDDVGIIDTIYGGQTSKEDKIPTKEEDSQKPPLEGLKDLAHEEKEVSYPRELNYVKDGEILGDPSKGVTTRSSLKLMNHVAFLSCIEPKNIKEALKDDFWILAMQEELNQFERSKVWTLVERPNNQSTIGTKWVFRNKLDENGNIVRNKARLVAQGYTQEEGIDFDETYAPVARMEAIRMLLAFACYHDFKLFQMDVKSAFLNGFINEEVYVEQPPGFEDSKFPNHVFKLTKALYGLKQAPRAWYERLSTFLIEKGFEKGKVDTTLFIKRYNNDILVVQIYVDDIIFGSTNECYCKDFSKLMQGEFEMSMMGELSFFLGLQIKQMSDGTFINQAKYVSDMLKKFGLENAKPQATPMSSSIKLDKDEGGKCVDSKLYRSMIGSLLYLTASRPDIMFSVCLCARFQASPKESHLVAIKRIFRYLIDTPTLGLWYPKDSTFSLHAFSDADYGGCKIDRKSTSGTCQFLGSMLVSWFSKKQNSVALSTTEAEYISLGSCCAQVLWMKQQLLDYGVKMETIPLRCDNTSAICLTKNPIQHSRTKHIEIRHHFIRDYVSKNDVVIEFVDTLNQLADIFTKPLDKDRFWTLRRELGLTCLS